LNRGTEEQRNRRTEEQRNRETKDPSSQGPTKKYKEPIPAAQIRNTKGFTNFVEPFVFFMILSSFFGSWFFGSWILY